MLRHIVLFALEGFESPEQRAAHLEHIKRSLERLPEVIAPLESLSVHLNENPAEAYDFALEAIVPSLEELPAYAQHPEHLRIVQELIKPYLKQRACVDFRLS